MSDIDWDNFVKFEPLRKKLCRQLCKEGFNFDDVDDVLFNMFLIRAMRGGVFIKDYLYSEAKAKLNKRQQHTDKHQKRHERHYLRNSISFETPFDTLDRQEQIELLMEGVSKLDMRYKFILEALMAGENFSTIAKDLRISRWAVHRRIPILFHELKKHVKFCQFAEWKCANFPKIELSGHGNHS